jgi:D-amino-acid dehydrogenase
MSSLWAPGVVGVTTAWYLRQHGHDVTVIDRQAKPAAETSHANGGQISVSHAEPWANPSAPLKVLRWLFKEDAPLLIRLRADPAQWRWCLRFLLECTPARTRSNIRQIVALGLYSRRSLGELRQALDLHYDDLQKGILHFYTSETEFAAAREPARECATMAATLSSSMRKRSSASSLRCVSHAQRSLPAA